MIGWKKQLTREDRTRIIVQALKSRVGRTGFISKSILLTYIDGHLFLDIFLQILQRFIFTHVPTIFIAPHRFQIIRLSHFYTLFFFLNSDFSAPSLYIDHKFPFILRSNHLQDLILPSTSSELVRHGYFNDLTLGIFTEQSLGIFSPVHICEGRLERQEQKCGGGYKYFAGPNFK